jgi:hypothetical protein
MVKRENIDSRYPNFQLDTRSSGLSSRSGLSAHSSHNVADESPEPKAGLTTQIWARYVLNVRLGGMGRLRVPGADKAAVEGPAPH